MAQFGFGGVRVRTPGVGVTVGRGGVTVRAPGTYVRTPARVYSSPRRTFGYGGYGYGGFYYGPPGVTVRSSGGVYHGGSVYRRGTTIVTGGAVVTGNAAATATPTLAPGPTQATGPTLAVEPTPTVVTASAAAEIRFASEAELAAMVGGDLLGAMNEASMALDARLNGFQNGAGWKTYLALEAAGTGDLAAAEKLLRRYDSVARDAQFSMISELEEFAAVRLALRVLVDRGGAAAPAVPSEVSIEASSESLPMPSADAEPANEPAAVEVTTPGVKVKVERSVLVD